MRTRVSVYLLALSLLVGCGGMVLAQEQEQEQEPPNIAQAWYFKVKPQMFMQFEAALKEHIAWHKETEGVWGWNVFQVITGPRYGEYIIRSYNQRWEDFDANMEYFQKQVMQFRLKVLPLVESIDCRIMQVDWENTRWPEEEGQTRLIEVYQYYINPTMMAQFDEARKELHEAFVKANWDVHYAWALVRSGGAVPAAYLILPRGSWADFADPEKSYMEVLTEVYGEEKAAEVVAKFREGVAKIKSFAVRYRPDLSYKPNM